MLRRPLVLLLGVVALGIVLLLLVRSRDRLPSPGSAEYEDITRTFYRGLASLQVGLLDGARQDFTQATERVPREPASWANLGLARLRLGAHDVLAAIYAQFEPPAVFEAADGERPRVGVDIPEVSNADLGIEETLDEHVVAARAR